MYSYLDQLCDNIFVSVTNESNNARELPKNAFGKYGCSTEINLRLSTLVPPENEGIKCFPANQHTNKLAKHNLPVLQTSYVVTSRNT